MIYTYLRRALVTVALALLPAVASAQIPSRTSITTAGSDCSTATNCAGFDTKNLQGFGVYINVGASGTFVFEVSQDATSDSTGTWVPLDDDLGDPSATTDGAYYFANKGFVRFRLRASAISGTATVAPAKGFGLASGSGGAGAASVITDLEDGAGESVGDDANDAIRVNVVAGAASGASHTDDNAFTPATDDGAMAFAFFDDVAPDSVNEGDGGAIRMSANRNLYSTIRDAAGNERGANVTAANELLVELGAGSASIGTLGANSGVDIGDVTLTANNGVDIGDVTLTAGSASIGTLGANSGVDIGDVTLTAGSASIGTLGANSGVDIGDVTLTAGTANIGNVDLQVDVSGTPTVQTGSTEGSLTGAHVILVDPATNAAAVFAGACTPGSIIGGASVNETEIKDTGGYLDWLYVSSLDATPVYLKLYDLDNDDLDENDTPIARIMIPANGTAANGAGATTFIPAGMTFANAISFRVTTGLADNSTGALTANEVLISWCYR
jgi:hypothetical protein